MKMAEHNRNKKTFPSTVPLGDELFNRIKAARSKFQDTRYTNCYSI